MTLETSNQIPFENRCHRVLQFARDLYRQSPDWVRFFREVVGVDGAARKLFTTQEEFIAFERSDAFHTIKRMVNALRNNKSTSHSEEEATRVITVRLPESLHEALKAEADDHGTSMNKLCISKLLQVLEEDEATQRARAAQRLTPPRIDVLAVGTNPAARSVTAPAYASTPSPNSNPSYLSGTGSTPQSLGEQPLPTPPYRPNFG
jgi:predicted HicB family RNase H-like nuclease